MKNIKKPKLLPLPKQPKTGANSTVWESYSQKLDLVNAENVKRIKAYDAAVKSRQKRMAKIEAIKNKALKIKKGLSGF